MNKTPILAVLVILAAIIIMVILVQKKKEEKFNLSNRKILMIIAPKDFRDEELLVPKDFFEKSGAKVVVASKDVSEATGMLGTKVKIDINLSDINVDEYDAIIFVGGVGAKVYFEDLKAHEIARESYEKGKVLAAICIAPSILANAGLLKNKKATAFPSEEDNLVSKGAIYTGNDVEVDGKIVTAKGPFAAKIFAEEIAKLLK